jgi:hypothetical protein
MEGYYFLLYMHMYSYLYLFENSVADPGCSSIPDLGSQIPDPTTAIKEGEKIGCPTFFCSHKYHNIVNNFIFEQVPGT